MRCFTRFCQFSQNIVNKIDKNFLAEYTEFIHFIECEGVRHPNEYKGT